jgi:hypothetical protein
MTLTLVDNKVCNTIASTIPAMRCYIFNAQPFDTANILKEIANSIT